MPVLDQFKAFVRWWINRGLFRSKASQIMKVFYLIPGVIPSSLTICILNRSVGPPKVTTTFLNTPGRWKNSI